MSKKIINLKSDEVPKRKLRIIVLSILILVGLSYGNSKIVEGYQESKERPEVIEERVTSDRCLQEEGIRLEDSEGSLEVQSTELREVIQSGNTEDIQEKEKVEGVVKGEGDIKIDTSINKQGNTNNIPEEVKEFVEWYPGSRIDSEYLALLNEECNDDNLLKEVVAISVAEGAMGRDLPHRQSNFWGWFKGGDRNYDPSREEMAEVICTGIGDNYRGIGNSPVMIARYTGNDRASNWKNIFSWSMSQMN